MDYISEVEVLLGDRVCVDSQLSEMKLLRYGLWIPLVSVVGSDEKKEKILNFIKECYPHRYEYVVNKLGWQKRS